MAGLTVDSRLWTVDWSNSEWEVPTQSNLQDYSQPGVCRPSWWSWCCQFSVSLLIKRSQVCSLTVTGGRDWLVVSGWQCEGRLGHQRLPGKTGPRDGHTSSTPSNVKGAAGPQSVMGLSTDTDNRDRNTFQWGTQSAQSGTAQSFWGTETVLSDHYSWLQVEPARSTQHCH